VICKVFNFLVFVKLYDDRERPLCGGRSPTPAADTTQQQEYAALGSGVRCSSGYLVVNPTFPSLLIGGHDVWGSQRSYHIGAGHAGANLFLNLPDGQAFRIICGPLRLAGVITGVLATGDD